MIIHNETPNFLQNIAFFNTILLFKTFYTLLNLSYIINSKVPVTIKINPNIDFLDSFSFKNIYANKIVTNMLNLSIGTTTEANPSCNAL